ncbi:MAG: ABC transporter ATP-binding protein [Acidimicrobiia bacterium]|nr:ABC transporter ATP-binding protein [Acidimicrobiia bacterium]
MAKPTSASDTAIVIRDLRKSFGHLEVLRGLDLDVRRGSITGFLGPNGAGKTTTIRAMLGLVTTDAGSIRILGRHVPDELVDLRGRLGAVVDRPSVYPPLTGRANLRVLAGIAGGVTASRVDVLLELVGLLPAADRKAGTYSHGMRQRLALAAALLTEPELLVLDEPASGLDPAGQRDLRRILTDLRDTGSTILLSSHVLPDVQLLCDHIHIIDSGRLIASGATEDLLAGAHGTSWTVDVPAGSETEAARILGAGGLHAIPTASGTLTVDAADPAHITRVLGEAGIWLRGLSPGGTDLESLFLHLTEASPDTVSRRGEESP